jgi:hypothetical protein
MVILWVYINNLPFKVQGLLYLPPGYNYFPKQHQTVGICNEESVCLLWGINWIFVYASHTFSGSEFESNHHWLFADWQNLKQFYVGSTGFLFYTTQIATDLPPGHLYTASLTGLLPCSLFDTLWPIFCGNAYFVYITLYIVVAEVLRKFRQ